jgi:hypothetical protein
MNTRITTTTDLWNCTTTATKTETRGEQHIRYNKSNQRRDSYSNLDFDYCCGFIYRYRVRSSALFTSLGYIHAFVIAIQLAQRRKCELDSTREYTIVNWQQGQDEVILTIKKRIVNYFHHMLKDLYPSASSFSTSILVKVDMLDVIIYALLLILCYWSLLPHGLWGSIHGITGMTEVVQLAYSSHPNLEAMVRYYASSLQDYIQQTNARNWQELKRQVVKFAILHPLDFYYYLRLVNNSCTLFKYIFSAVDAFVQQFGARTSLRKAKEEYRKAKVTIDVLTLIIDRKEKRLCRAIIVLQRRFRCKKMIREERIRRASSLAASRRLISDSRVLCYDWNEKICADNSFTSDHFERLQLMKRQVQSLNKNQASSFLLRPSTKNAILWRRLSLVCATLELLQNALYPILLRSTGATSLEECLYTLMSWRICHKDFPRSEGANSYKAIFLNLFLSSRREAIRCPVSSFWERLRLSFYIWFIYQFLWIAGTVKFINCFVDVFEGSYDNEGVLVPKPFIGKHLRVLCCSCLSIKATITTKKTQLVDFLLFSPFLSISLKERWIFPGLLFQIMVNPMLSQMLDFLKRLFRFLLFIGLARTARWVFAVKNCAVLPEKKIIDAR